MYVPGRESCMSEQPHPSKTRAALVIGAGIAGIQAALDMANAGVKVYLVEQEPSIGGHMAQLDKTFPTLDCSACILTPRMVEVARHPNIVLLTYSEVESVEGEVGHFRARIRKKARSVDLVKCTGCGLCVENCPIRYEPYLPDHDPSAAGATSPHLLRSFAALKDKGDGGGEDLPPAEAGATERG
jgi:heterodisulfide reductase subunit A-like polyferredoxin